MITIRNIVVHDGTRMTDAGKDLCARVYEANTGKCWHIGQRDLSAVVLGGVSTRDSYACKKCGYIFLNGAFVLKYCEDVNPNLLHDLNAVHELESCLWTHDKPIPNPPVSLSDYAEALVRISGGVLTNIRYLIDERDDCFVIQLDSAFFLAHAKAHHKVEALASVVQVECGACGGGGKKTCTTCRPDNHRWAVCDGEGFQQCESCSGTGRASILDQWEREWGGK